MSTIFVNFLPHLTPPSLCAFYLFKRQTHRIVKATQTIRRLLADELFECVLSFCGVGA